MKYTEIMKNVDANSKRGVNMPGQRARIIIIIKSTRVVESSQKQITNYNKELTLIAHDDDDDAGRLTPCATILTDLLLLPLQTTRTSPSPMHYSTHAFFIK
jgi:hypothetical protein